MVRTAFLLVITISVLVAFGSRWLGGDAAAYCGAPGSHAEPSLVFDSPPPPSVLGVPPEQMRALEGASRGAQPRLQSKGRT